MPVEENIVLMRRWFKEVWNEGRVQTIYDLVDENVIAVGQDAPGIEIHGPADFLRLYNRLRGAFPDIKFTLEDTTISEYRLRTVPFGSRASPSCASPKAKSSRPGTIGTSWP